MHPFTENKIPKIALVCQNPLFITNPKILAPRPMTSKQLRNTLLNFLKTAVFYYTVKKYWISDKIFCWNLYQSKGIKFSVGTVIRV